MTTRTLVLAALIAGTHTGCALITGAFAHHNSRGAACIDNPTFAVVDLSIAGLSAAGLASSGALDDSTGVLVIPGVFLVSGLIGAISAGRCDRNTAGPDEAPPASNSAPAFGDAPVDPEARMATPEEMGIGVAPTTPTLVPVLPGLPAIDLQRQPDPTPATPPPPRPPDVSAPGTVAPVRCTITPATPCPAGHVCQFEDDTTSGVCVPER